MEVGRPTVMTADTIAKLEQAFLMGCSDLEACLCAGIDKATMYRYQKENPDFCDRKDRFKKNPVMKARKNMLALMDSEDEHIKFKSSAETLNRYEGKAKERLELSGPGGGPIHSVTTEMTAKEAAQAFKDQIKES